MSQTADILLTIRMIFKFYEHCLEDVRMQYHLSGMELKIISFLHNNPSKNTVRDIAENRMLSKGNVSRGVDSLIQKGFMCRVPDPKDRRWVRLHLEAAADPIIQAVEEAGEKFSRQMLQDFSPEEVAVYENFNQRLTQNIHQSLRRSNCHEQE